MLCPHLEIESTNLISLNGGNKERKKNIENVIFQAQIVKQSEINIFSMNL